MQPLILLAIAGIAVAALGAGSLANVITLNVQEIGVGEATLTSPLDGADVNFIIARQSGAVGGTTEIHNVIAACEIHVNEGFIRQNDVVYCKLTDENGNVVAEGTNTAPEQLDVSETIIVTVNDFPNNKVQNIHDVIIVVQGP